MQTEIFDNPLWEELVDAQPLLADLLAEAKAIRGEPGKSFCANSVWYGACGWPGLKARMERLVGWDVDHDPLLGAESSYDTVYETIYDARPDCVNCGCL